MSDPNIPNALPHTIGGRMLLFVVASPLAFFSGWGMIINFAYAKPPTLLHQFANVGLQMVMLSVCAAAGLSVIWSLFAPAWLAELVHRRAGHAAIAVWLFVAALIVIGGIVLLFA
ncbi:MAG: hypothetical protein KDA25_10445 [Phycisphaerales bacterium]|nr:hypothetical protein [Phycisphaerales bacterium]